MADIFDEILAEAAPSKSFTGKRYVGCSGPPNARIALVGEAPAFYEEIDGRPFTGPSGKLLDGMLHDAGILRSDCFTTNVLRFRAPQDEVENSYIVHATKGAKIPKGFSTQDYKFYKGRWVVDFVPQHVEMLKQELELVRPNVVVALGNTALWALTGQSGITNWAGTILPCTLVPSLKVIANYHPAAVGRMYEWRFNCVQFFRTVKRESSFPEIHDLPYVFHVRPQFRHAMDFLRMVKDFYLKGGESAADIETRARHIACIGFSLSKLEAMCIPLMCVERPGGYWDAKEEFALVSLMREILALRRHIGQNFLYDSQYIARYWGAMAVPLVDTMAMQHTCFPGTPKGLDDLVKLYAEQPRFWKNESKEWDPKLGEDQLWNYNCKDCCYTHEVKDVLEGVVDKMGQRENLRFQMSRFEPTLRMMLRGVRQNPELKQTFSKELELALDTRRSRLAQMFGHVVNPNSPHQLKRLFYIDMRQQEIKKRGKKGMEGGVTVDDEALKKIRLREPLLAPACDTIAQCRTMNIYKSTFVDAAIEGGRIRSSFNPYGPETFRWSSSTDAFGAGCNLQNIPRYDEEEEEKKKAEDKLPDVRRLFVPDEGHTIWDADFNSADAYVVAWESEDPSLKQMLREGIKIAKVNAKELHVSYYVAKVAGHATNYGGKARTLAASCGVTVHEIEKFQKRYFEKYPGILKWHKRVEESLLRTRSVANKFGYRIFYFGRIESLLGEALAWVPQSTVACVANRAMARLERELPWAVQLIQVHDSIVGQSLYKYDSQLAEIPEKMKIVVPYDDPLVIPASIKASRVSWGECGNLDLLAV